MIRKQILDVLGFPAFTEMQERFLDESSKHPFIQLLAPTGSGKTLAFLTFILEKLNPEESGVQALIMVPGRELALQIESVFKQIKSGYKIVSCYGGHEFRKEKQQLIEAPALIIGTPGRVAQHLEWGNFNPRSIKILVIDEFDKALEQGFDDDMGYIVKSLGSLSQAVLTSATPILEQAPYLDLKNYYILDWQIQAKGAAERQFYKVQLVTNGSTSINNLDERAIFSLKFDSLKNLLTGIAQESVLVFCKTRAAVDELYATLNHLNYSAERYHGAMEQRDREVAVFKFDNGTVNILVCTDLAARGLDIQVVKHVIHFEEAIDEASFTHRNGRTGRLQQDMGKVYMLYLEERDLEKYQTEFIDFTPVELDRLNKSSGNLENKDQITIWDTIYLNLGKQEKIQKGDILGFLTKDLKLNASDVGKILIKDKASYFALNRAAVNLLIQASKSRKLKNKKFKVEVAK